MGQVGRFPDIDGDGFDHANALSEHHTQYFEMLGNRAIYQDGWVAAARHLQPYDVSKDFSQAHDLAARYPDRLKK